MNIGNSPLFKDMARPLLLRIYGRGDVQPRRLRGVVDSVMQFLLDRSQVDVSAIRIDCATEDSCDVTVEFRFSKTGAISSTISEMDIGLAFNGFSFAQIKLPEVKTSLWGTNITIHRQKLRITNMASFKAYIRSIILDDETNFQLEGGRCTITTLGVVANCDYRMDIPIRGMGGPKATILRLKRTGRNVTVVLSVENPSPVEVDLGLTVFELRAGNAPASADLKGPFEIKRGTFVLVLRGVVKVGAVLSTHMRLVGVDTEEASWCRDAVLFLDLPVYLNPALYGVAGGP